MTFEEEMNAFKKHLIEALPLMESGDDIKTLTANIAIEYGDWKLGEVDDLSESSALEQWHEDMNELEQRQRVA